MRFDGLTSRNDPTGSGVIAPGESGDDIAAHASEFPHARPRASSGLAARHEQARPSSLTTGVLVILTACAALYYASMRHDGGQALHAAALEAGQAAKQAHEHRSDPIAASRFARPVSAPAGPSVRPGF